MVMSETQTQPHSGLVNMYGAGDQLAYPVPAYVKPSTEMLDEVDHEPVPVQMIVQGAAAFVVAAENKIDALEIADEDLPDTTEEPALRLIMTLSDNQGAEQRKENPDLVRHGIGEVLPRHRRPVQPSGHRAKYYQGRLFSLAVHGRTQKPVYGI